MTSEQKRTYAPAQTGVQAHATCAGVAGLTSSANILGWQGADPFYNYIPWQKTTANLGDDPSKWIPVVKTATGVDLSTLSTVTEFTNACTGLGGAYKAADTPSAIANALVAAAVLPLNTQISGLQAQGTRAGRQGGSGPEGQ